MKRIIVSVLGFLMLIGCGKQEENIKRVESLQDLAKEHSGALEYFYGAAVSNDLTFDVKGVKGSMRQENIIDAETAIGILGDYNFSSLSEIKVPTIKTKAGEIISVDYTNELDKLLEEIISSESFSSFDEFSEFVLSSVSKIGENDILKEYRDFTELALYILIDSYDYWINQEKFAEWITTICTPELRYQIALSIGHPELVCVTKSSAGEMRAWAEMCKSNDETTKGFLSAAVKSDSWGLAGSAVGGMFFGGLGVPACLFGAAWSSIGTLMGI